MSIENVKMTLTWVLMVNLAVALDGNECTHFTYFKGIHNGTCDRAIGWAEWIYFPNMFGDRTYEDFDNRITSVYNSGVMTEQDMKHFCYFIFPSCKANQRKIRRPGKSSPSYASKFPLGRLKRQKRRFTGLATPAPGSLGARDQSTCDVTNSPSWVCPRPFKKNCGRIARAERLITRNHGTIT